MDKLYQFYWDECKIIYLWNHLCPFSQVRLRKCRPNTNYNFGHACIIWHPFIFLTQPLCVVSSMELLLLLENFVILLKPMRSAMSKNFPQDWGWRLRFFYNILSEWKLCLFTYLHKESFYFHTLLFGCMHEKKTFRSKAITIITFACHNLSYPCVCTPIA